MSKHEKSKRAETKQPVLSKKEENLINWIGAKVENVEKIAKDNEFDRIRYIERDQVLACYRNGDIVARIDMDSLAEGVKR